MLSFEDFLSNINENSHESGAIKAIRNGIGINKNFWEDFLLLLNNAEAVSSLLDVPVEKIGTWHDSIKKAMDDVHKADGEIIPSRKKKLLKTGLPEDL
jgi:hypothetical protein